MSIDRIAPTRRPPARRSGTQRWRDLLFLHWESDPDALRRKLPPELALDLWDGQALIGVVPFAMQAVRPSWLPHALALDFLETNLRTYVVHRDTGEPGVWFFSLEAASWLAVQAARLGWGLPYHHARMHYLRGDDRDAWHYGTVRSAAPEARLEVRFRPGDALPQSPPDSLEFFLLERYVLFSHTRGRLARGQVHHPPYPARTVAIDLVRDGLLPAAGLPPVDGAPRYAHFSSGVDVEVFGPS